MFAMKWKVIFFCVLFTQTSASFFDEFRGVMSSVESSFGKLLNDVVVDVRETIGCTILAVKQVLALGGIFHESSDYDTRCRGFNNKETSTYVEAKKEDTIISSYVSKTDSNEKSLSERVSKEIDESVSNVHNKMLDLIDKNDAHKNILKAKANIVHESDRLPEITALLRRELSTISEEVKRELRKVESNPNPTVDGIWGDIRVLHEFELNHKNTPQATEIHHILNEILSVLRGDEMSTPNTVTPADKESDDAFAEIESQFEKMEEKEEKPIQLEKAEVKKDNSDIIKNSKDFPLTFKGVAKKIMDETSKTFRFADGSSQQYEVVVTTTTVKPSSTEKNVEYPEELPDYHQFFQLAPKDSAAHKEAVQEATSLIEKSKQNDAIMKDYFKKVDNVGTSVFDDPDLFGFA
ncbi:uncharacterized protein LOC114349951 [Ostrinia furnacalis]|uniref:uncharacterized protein LOC114349951 n=1 Tax=Ostrinia furnacalis TaxID=93504 RepID=UPI001039D70B|nr:uncharacterized protein LOC114349951 [Ostrinia furnacalis]